jgi:hypothetical protein
MFWQCETPPISCLQNVIKSIDKTKIDTKGRLSYTVNVAVPSRVRVMRRGHSLRSALAGMLDASAIYASS